jgi:hypothetical protein
MKIIACQFNKVSGPDATANYKVEFTVDESQRRGVQNLISLKKGTSLLLMMHEVDKDEEEIKEFSNETPNETRKRFNNRMHILIKEIANEKNVNSVEIKNSLKDFLKNKKLIKESTSELNISGLSTAIYYLQTEYGYN